MIIENKIMRNKQHIFPTRIDAGKRLAELIKNEQIDVLLIIPNGGLPIGLGLIKKKIIQSKMIDLLIVKKIHVPWSTEAGMGAITPDGKLFLNENLISNYSIEDQQIKNQVNKTKERIKNIKGEFGITEDVNVQGKTVLIVDDGIASGFSMLAGASWLKNKNAKKILIGTPTAPQSSLDILKDKVDKIFCLNIRTGLSFAVADAYQNWYDLSLSEAVDYYQKIMDLISD
ncbi:MAG: phosphoribosyltransferase [Asgard group archaeon]|nr:phosphoribosyltransferase [Asgard group archaeon]